MNILLIFLKFVYAMLNNYYFIDLHYFVMYKSSLKFHSNVKTGLYLKIYLRYYNLIKKNKCETLCNNSKRC